MSDALNEVIARRFREETWSTEGLNAIADIVADSCILHVEDPATPPTVLGPQGLRNIIEAFLQGFPDARMTVREVISDDSRVASFWTATASHSGKIWGLPPTNRAVTTSGIDLLRFESGKVVEARTRWDSLGLLAQIGAFPPTAAFLNDGQ
ncbi:MAG: ester cyclase [Planctomycetaceae bacterium]